MRSKKLWIFIGIVVLVLVLNHVFGWSEALSSGNLISNLQAGVAAHPFETAAMYVAVSIVACVALAVPGVVFALVAGTVFGALWGTILCWFAVIIGCAISFLVGRYFLKDALKPKLAQSKALNKILFEGADRSDVYVLAITRLVPAFPFNLQNFAYGITDIKFWRYTLFSALFLLPGTAAYTIAAAGIVDAEHRTQLLLVAVALIAVVLGISFVLKRKANIQAEEE